MKYLLDTNVISELVAKNPNPKVIDWIDGKNPTELYLSVITIGELRKGIEKLPVSLRKDLLLSWLENDLLLRFRDQILSIDISIMLTWGIVVGTNERNGCPMSAMDSLVAAVCLYHGCCLVTRNSDDFTNTGLTIVNPWL